MWVQNPNSGKWQRQVDKLPKVEYNRIRQDLEDLRFYSRMLNGTSYLPINNLDDIYDILSFTDFDSWFVTGTYAVGGVGDKEINTDTIYDEWNIENTEYNKTLKNLFTPEKVINDSLNNFLEVDVATTQAFDTVNGSKPGLRIDGVRLKVGHRVLVKDQIDEVTLSNTVNPDNFFDGNYYITEEDTSTTSYFFYNKNNGIYRYNGEELVRESDLDSYEDAVRYSIHVKLGDENSQTQWHLSRLLNGDYPLVTKDQPIEFLEKNNWILRNQVEYQNILDIDIYDSIKHSEQIVGSHSIPERTIFIGDFGSIFVHQTNFLHIIRNKFKFDLRDIDQTDEYYWVVGMSGSLLRIDKVTFEIKSIELNTLNTLTSIDFYNNLRGFIVGDLNEMYYTFDGGFKWTKIEMPEFENFKYNKVLYTGLNKVYIGGDNGVFIELNYNNGEWVSNKRVPIKIESIDDEFELVDNVTDIIKFTFNQASPWSLTYSSATSSQISNNKEGLMLVGSNDSIIIYDENNFIKDQSYIYLSTTQSIGDIKAVESTGQEFYIISDDHYKFDINSFTGIGLISNIVEGSVTKLISQEYNNIYNYEDTELILVGDNLNLESYTFSSPGVTSSFVDSSFKDKLKSRLLFLDYDIASKLNFFGDDLQYRLPGSQSVAICVTGSQYSDIEITSQSGELSWIDYNKDALKTFKYNTALSTANQVEYSTLFIGSSASNEYVVNGTQSTNEISEVQDVLNVTAPSSPTYSLFLYDELMVLKVDTSAEISEGDVMYLDANSVSGKFIVNRVETLSGDNYIYMNSYFNDTITNNITSSTQSVTFTNLNVYNDASELATNFNRHFIGDAYTATSSGVTYSSATYGICEDVAIEAKLTNKSAYYNLQSKIQDSTFGLTYTMDYSELFLNFGYDANYNILDYLNNINPIFNSGKTFYSMPVHNSIPYGGLDVRIDPVSANKIVFHPKYKFEWETLWLETFVDIEIDGDSLETTQKLLITKKYYDSDVDRYIIEVHKAIEEPSNQTNISILSRRTLSEISSDLNELNNIQRNQKESSAGSFNNYQKELNFKFSTDSYAKILLADGDIKENLTSIIYVDDDSELSMNIIDLGKVDNITINQVDSIPTALGLKTKFITDSNHNLSVGDYVIVSMDSDSDARYNGLFTVTQIVSSTQFVVGKDFDGAASTGRLRVFEFDPYLNYIPVDIIDVGTDGKGKIAVKIEPENVIQNDDETFTLEGLDLTKYRFNLIEGLFISRVAEEFPWILEAEIDDATIGINDEGIIWYEGIWHFGRWFNGSWYSGQWRDGEWYNGNWSSNKVTTTQISAKIDFNINDDTFSKWFGGNFRGGTWFNGSWYGGVHVDGLWENGDWFDGQWQQGVWENGRFMAGNWINGIWNNGLFNCNQGQSIWVDGLWNGGDFECGIWKNGKFTEQNAESRFGTRPTNSRKAIWESGSWLQGEFHSQLNQQNGSPTASLNHKYSVFETGKWSRGQWYGGTSYNIMWDSGLWVDGVSRDIDIIEVDNQGSDTVFKLDGVWNFNNLGEFFIIDNLIGGTYASLGTNDNPKKYIVKDTEFEFVDGVEVNTYLTTFGTVSATGSNVTSNIVSRFKGVEWLNGVWFNGIFDGDLFRSGIWINGTFRKGEWL